MEAPPAYDFQSLPSYSQDSSSSSSSSRRSSFILERSHNLTGGSVYHSDHIKVRLDRGNPSSRFAAYGFNDLVTGVVEVNPKFMNYAVAVTASLEATTTIALAPSGLKSEPVSHKTAILLNKTTIFESNPDLGYSRDGRYSFSIPFPTYLPGKHDLLPPSYTLYHLIASYQINYVLKIDVVRRGLRRHERVTIPILYLPRTDSGEHNLEVPKYASDNGILVSENDQAIAVDLTSKLLDEHVPTTNLILPSPKRFASGESIPVTLSWSSPKSPALTALWSKRGNVSIEVIKRSRIWVGSGESRHSVKDTLISEARFSGMDESVEGVSVSRWTLQAGICAQKEMSWHVKGVADVRYLIRVSIEAPDGISSQTETVRHEEYIDIATDVLTLESAEESLPALGFITIGADKPICRV